MRRTVHWSWWYLLPFWVAMVAVDVVLLAFRAQLPTVIWVGGGLLFSALALAYLWQLIARKPILTLDETGFSYHQRRLPKILWRDVLAAELLPRVQRGPVSESSCWREAWRPIRLRIRVPDQAPSQVTIHFFGTNADSAKILQEIQRRLPKLEGGQ